jgi:hypothetical protein
MAVLLPMRTVVAINAASTWRRPRRAGSRAMRRCRATTASSSNSACLASDHLLMLLQMVSAQIPRRCIGRRSRSPSGGQGGRTSRPQVRGRHWSGTPEGVARSRYPGFPLVAMLRASALCLIAGKTRGRDPTGGAQRAPAAPLKRSCVKVKPSAISERTASAPRATNSATSASAFFPIGCRTKSAGS